MDVIYGNTLLMDTLKNMNLYKKVNFFLIINCSFHGWRSVVLLFVTIITWSSLVMPRSTSYEHSWWLATSAMANHWTVITFRLFFFYQICVSWLINVTIFFYSASELGRIIDFIAKINFLPYAWFFFFSKEFNMCLATHCNFLHGSCSWRLLWSMMKLILQNECIPCRLQ